MLKNKERILELIYNSFKTNKSIKFMIGNDSKSDIRYRYLLEYSFKKAMLFGDVFINESKNCAAIVIDSRKKRFSLKSILLDIGLIINVIGLNNLNKVMKRESLLKDFHPKNDFIHLWYIGVDPEEQGKGIGSIMLKSIIEEYKDIDMYLETSNSDNYHFYKKNGFRVVGDLDLKEYKLKMFKRDRNIE